MTLAQFRAFSRAAIRLEQRMRRDEVMNMRAAQLGKANDFQAYLKQFGVDV